MRVSAHSLRLLPLLLLSACFSSGTPAGPLGPTPLIEDDEAATITAGRLELRGLRLVPIGNPAAPVEPWVPGRIRAGVFFPEGPLVGPLGAPEGRRGLVEGTLELRTRQFFRLDEERARELAGPTVRGLKDPENSDFFPLEAIRGLDAAGE